MLIYSLIVCVTIVALASFAFAASVIAGLVKLESYLYEMEDKSIPVERTAYLLWIAFFACSWWYTYAYLTVEKEDYIATFYGDYVKLDRDKKAYDLLDAHAERLRKEGYFLGDTVYYRKHGTKFLIMFSDQDGVYNKYQE